MNTNQNVSRAICGYVTTYICEKRSKTRYPETATIWETARRKWAIRLMLDWGW